MQDTLIGPGVCFKTKQTNKKHLAKGDGGGDPGHEKHVNKIKNGKFVFSALREGRLWELDLGALL